jgi:chromosome segregation ATPase
MADMKFVADYSDIQTMRRELVGVSKDAKKSAAVFETAYNKAERQLQRTAKANQQFYNETLKIDKTTKSASQSASVFTQELRKQEKATEAYAKETRRLQLQYNTTFKAADSFKRQLRELNEAHARSAISTDRHEKQVMQLKDQYREFLRTGGTAMNQFGQLASKTQQKTKRFASVGLQQAGYQVGDFAVQVQSGTNALVAFGQQGSQLAGIFGPAGAVAGALIAIGTAVGNVAFESIKAAGSSKTFEEALEDLSSAVSDYKSAVTQASADTTELNLRFGKVADSIKPFLKDLQELERIKALNNLEQQFNKLETKSSTFFQKFGAAVVGGAALQKELADQVGLTVEQYDALQRGVEGLQQAETVSDRVRVAREVRDLIRQSVGDVGNMTEEMRGFYNSLVRAVIAGGELEGDFEDSGEAVSRMNDELSRTERMLAAVRQALDPQNFMRAEQMMSGMADEAERLADNLIDATTRFGRMMTMAQRGFDVDPQGFMRSGQDIPGDPTEPTPTRGGGGGGTQTDPRAFLESLQKELDLKRLLVGVNEAQAERLKLESQLKERLNEVGQQITEGDRKRIDALVRQAEAIRKAEAAEERRRASIERFENQMSDSIQNIVTEAKSIEDAFLSVIRNIVAELFKKNVADPIAGGIGDILGGGFFGGGSPLGGGSSLGSQAFDIAGSFANGNAFSNGKVTAFATGGVVDKPTMFPMANGAGLMGEAGPEAIMPLKRGKNGKLGVQTEGSQAPVVIHQSFNFSANGDDSVKRIIAQEAPKIAELTQKQILSQRSRGGVWKTTFG